MAGRGGHVTKTKKLWEIRLEVVGSSRNRDVNIAELGGSIVGASDVLQKNIDKQWRLKSLFQGPSTENLKKGE